MKKILTNFPALLLFLFAQFLVVNTAYSQGVQGTDDDGFVIQITSPASIAQTIVHGFDPGVCQWIGQTAGDPPMPWGADITGELCGEVVWADDSLGCTAFTNASALAGKIALIRRGTCGFSVKVSWAKKSGAIAAIIVNHYANAQDGPCTTFANATQYLGGLTGLDSASTATIPAVFIERMTGEEIDGALAAGQTVNICFSFPRLTGPTSASMYATPVNQVGTMQAITVLYNNRSGATQTDVNLKADFIDPSGTHTGSVTYNMPVCEPGVDSFIVFPPYLAPAAKGKHTVLFTNDKYNEPIDSVYSYFEHTDYTFATDNLEVDPGGVGPSDADFAGANFYIQSGGLVLMGSDAPAKATYATFGLSNAAALFDPSNPSASIVGVALYKADVDGDGAGDLSSSFTDDLGAGLLSYEEYVITGNELDGDLIHVPLNDINLGTPGVDLEVDQAYYISLIYDGTAVGLGIAPRFSNSRDVGYAAFTGYPTTPLYFGSLFTGGWQGAMVIQRLQLDGFVPGVKTVEPKTLDASKINITPNPANEFVNLELKLDAVNASVAASVIDGKGQMVVGSKVEKNFQNGMMTLNVKSLPAGTYYLWIRTAEGSTMKPIVVAH
ncbi:MAG: T9SS type A sorting domain-containing protein [Lewinellaceae bacterium]|nr:T9SS type A sorting domain-containing protein [Lewinellaceae bacterium]